MRVTPLIRVVAARFVSRSGSEAAFFVGIWGKLAYELEGNVADIAFVLAIAGFTAMIGSGVAGTLVDRFGPKRVLIVAEILFVPSVLSVLLVETVPQFAAAVALIGITSSPASTAIASLPPFLTTDHDRLGRMNALIEGAGMAALILGSAIGGVLAITVGLDAIFIFDAITSLIAVGFVATLPLLSREVASATGATSGWTEFTTGLKFSWNHPRLRFYLAVGASLWLVFGLFTALEPLFYRDILNQGPETIGWVNSLFGIGLVVGTVTAARFAVRLQSARIVLVLLMANGIGTMLYAGTRLIVVVASAGVVWGVVIGLFAPAVRTMLHINSPHDMVGRVMGTSQGLAEMAKLGPLVAAPSLAAWLGVQATMVGSGALLIVIGIGAWRAGAHLDATRAAATMALGAQADGIDAGPGMIDEPTGLSFGSPG